jgi:SOS-response transcriptional repressor LexA
MMGLTKQQAQVLAFIQARMPCIWRAPSYRQLTAYRGVAVQSNYQHARRLERKGALTTARLHRNIRLSPEHGPPACLPITGRVAASTSILTVEKPRRLPGDRLSVRGSIEPVRPLCQGRQHGEPIELRGRLADRPQPWVEPADVGVVVIDEAVMVKTILHRRTDLWLKPEKERQRYPPIRL